MTNIFTKWENIIACFLHNAASIGDLPSRPDLISPNYYRKFAYPFITQRVADLNTKNVKLAYHICGNFTSIVADMVRTSAIIIEIDLKADMQTCKEAACGKSTVLGPIDPREIIANGTPEMVTEKYRQAVEFLALGGGFILGPGCALPDTTPDVNIDALIEFAKIYGRYHLTSQV